MRITGIVKSELQDLSEFPDIVLRQAIHTPHMLQRIEPLVRQVHTVIQALVETVQLHKVKKNRLIHNLVRDFFPESVLRHEPVPPDPGVAPVELRP